MFKEPRTRSEARSRAQQRDALSRAAFVLDHCKIEPEMSAKLKQLAEQMDAAIRRTAYR